jgi:hypothetical protein
LHNRTTTWRVSAEAVTTTNADLGLLRSRPPWRARSLLVLIGVAVSLAAAPAPAATPDSGVAGVVRASRCIPAPPRRSCPAAAAVVEIRRVQDNVLMRRLRVGPGAHFRVPLRPGRYVVRLLASTTRLLASQAVTVRPHTFSLVVLASGRG